MTYDGDDSSSYKAARQYREENDKGGGDERTAMK